MPITDIKKYNQELMKAEESKSAHPAMQLQDKKPVIVDTYYNLNRKSSVSNTLGRIETYIDPLTSPLRFNAISNLIMYGYNEDGVNIADHQQLGTKEDAVFKSIVMANAFEPFVGDFIKLQIDSGWLFVVTNVLDINNVTFINQSMYEITYKKYVPSTSTKFTDIDKQVSEELFYMPENVGTDKSLLVKKDDYNKSVDILNSYMHLVTQYIKQYYHKLTNSFLAMDKFNPKVFIYSAYLTEFIKSNYVIYMPVKDIELHISHESLLMDDFTMKYDQSIYAKFIDGDEITLDVISREFVKESVSGTVNPFSHFYLALPNYSLLEENDVKLNILRNTSGIDGSSVFSIVNELDDSFNKDLVDMIIQPDTITNFNFSKLKFTKDNITAYLLIPLILYKLRCDYESLTGGNKSVNSVLADIFGV